MASAREGNKSDGRRSVDEDRPSVLDVEGRPSTAGVRVEQAGKAVRKGLPWSVGFELEPHG